MKLKKFKKNKNRKTTSCFPPSIVSSDPTTVEYPIHELIGTSSDGDIKVHRATYFLKDSSAFDNMNVHNLSVSLKLIRADQESQHYNNLVQHVKRNRLLPHHYRNIMGIENAFIDKGIYCIVFPRMGHDSLRSIMHSQFPNCIPLQNIVVALKEAPEGLSFLHDNGQVHKEISIGQIFFSRAPEIRLSFSGSVYDHGTDQDNDNPHHLSMKSISRWASAPKVHNLQNDELYYAKADIWLIGITALELAYGEVKIRSRGHFLSIVDEMKDEQRLLALRDIEQSPPPSKVRLILGRMDLVVCKVKKRFDKFVCKCLAYEPANKPTAHELLDSKLFVKTKKNVVAFHNILR